MHCHLFLSSFSSFLFPPLSPRAGDISLDELPDFFRTGIPSGAAGGVGAGASGAGSSGGGAGQFSSTALEEEEDDLLNDATFGGGFGADFDIPMTGLPGFFDGNKEEDDLAAITGEATFGECPGERGGCGTLSPLVHALCMPFMQAIFPSSHLPLMQMRGQQLGLEPQPQQQQSPPQQQLLKRPPQLLPQQQPLLHPCHPLQTWTLPSRVLSWTVELPLPLQLPLQVRLQ